MSDAMGKMLKHSIVIAAAFAAVLAMPAQADFDSGLAAYHKQDFATALKEWQPLVDQGNPRALRNVGLMYLLGQGVKANPDKAIEFLQKAVDGNDPEAMRIMAQVYIDGRVPKLGQSLPMGTELLRRASSLGDTEAQYQLAKLLYRAENLQAAIPLLATAANNGHKAAALTLAQILEMGVGVKKDQAEADKYYAMAGGKPKDIKQK